LLYKRYVLLVFIPAFIPTTVLALDPINFDNSPWGYKEYENEPSASDISLPITSFLLPGFGQWLRGQTTSALTYSSIAIGSANYADQSKPKALLNENRTIDFTLKDVGLRKYLLGLQIYQASGGFSLYHTFRSSVWQRQKFGQYNFLGQGETTLDLLKAPFNYEYLLRPSTFITLAVASGASWYLATHPTKEFHKSSLRREDPWFASAFSYGAGTHEEAIFRGWAMPVLHEYGCSEGIANLTQSLLFAAAHLGTNPQPWPQFLLGFHLGKISLKNRWMLGESVFIHTWWDVAAFLATYHLTKKNPIDEPENKPLSARLVKLRLPPLVISF
jgi:membrane protease YdiL (CAAX protease family)